MSIPVVQIAIATAVLATAILCPIAVISIDARPRGPAGQWLRRIFVLAGVASAVGAVPAALYLIGTLGTLGTLGT